MPLITNEGMRCVKPPSLRIPNSTCNTQAVTTQRKNISIEPNWLMAIMATTVSPAAGPLTLNTDLLTAGMICPPMMPAKRPDSTGVPEANDIPRQSDEATKNRYACL